MSDAAATSAKPWYREFWPWALMLPPGLAVVGGAIMVYLASSAPNALVVDDYARIEEITNERFSRDLRAAELGLQADIALTTSDPSTTRLTIAVEAPAAWVRPEGLTVRLRHAADSSADREVVAVRFDDRYVAAAALASGRYSIELLPPDESWRLAGLLPGASDSLTLAPPARAGTSGGRQ